MSLDPVSLNNHQRQTILFKITVPNCRHPTHFRDIRLQLTQDKIPKNRIQAEKSQKSINFREITNMCECSTLNRRHVEF
jgi:hypothetical protein